MTNRDHSSGERDAAAHTSNSRKVRIWIGGAIGTITLATVVAFASGLGNRAAESVGQYERAPLSYSVEEESPQCLSGIFLPKATAQEVLEGPVDFGVDLMELDPASAAADRNMVQVAIQGESERTVTLTSIRFRVNRLPPPSGFAFDFPCGGATVGRAIEVDLDTVPPRITASSAEVGGTLGTYRGRPISRPIRFPWTVSLTDPLLLYIFGTTDRCYCTWTAEIPWVSGSMRGVISVNNEGEGFRVMNSESVDTYGVGSGGRWIQTQ